MAIGFTVTVDFCYRNQMGGRLTLIRSNTSVPRSVMLHSDYKLSCLAITMTVSNLTFVSVFYASVALRISFGALDPR